MRTESLQILKKWLDGYLGVTQEGAAIESQDLFGNWHSCKNPIVAVANNLEIRFAQKSPSIDWNAVAPQYVCLTIDANRRGRIHQTVNPLLQDTCWHSPYMQDADVFSSFDPGTRYWKEATILRPAPTPEEPEDSYVVETPQQTH